MPPTPPSIRHGATPQVKLPKLLINGDLMKWVTFWDSLNSLIHRNLTLSVFNYLTSLLESSVEEAITGLTLTAANYSEAIEIIKKRFGNSQLIVTRHMETLLSIPAISSRSDVRGPRKVHDTVEAHVRGLQALGVSTTA